ncbi:TRAP transporter small permease [Hydrogenophaga sp.]|jgi:TRAP-type C4-dicarboxylate transport system permease small subunit|uniref:TRAP transporter small permease n=1 Tax=Hydrogenophaga sp. TaxID=1904254 RepID=UPI003F707121
MVQATPGRIERALTYLGTLSLLALMAIVFVDVLGRNLFNSPLLWGTELAEVLLAVMVFVFYPVLARRGGHIVVDLIPVPRATRVAQRVLAGGVGAALFGIVALCCGRQALRSAEYGDASAILGLPTAWVLWGMTALAGLSALVFVGQALGMLGESAAPGGHGD